MLEYNNKSNKRTKEQHNKETKRKNESPAGEPGRREGARGKLGELAKCCGFLFQRRNEKQQMN